jgi:ABC-2 type transport system permease protein
MLPVFSLFLAELRRDVRAWWSYRTQALSSLGLWLVAFPFMMATFDGVADGYGAERQLASLIGFLVWELCAGVLAATTESVTTEARQGTLESVILAPVPPLLTFWLRLTAVFTRQAVETLVLGLALALLLGLYMVPGGLALLVALLTLLGVAGVGLALGGLALVYKSVDSVVAVVSLLAVLFTGALVPLNSLGLVFTLLKLLLPMTWGIDLLRQSLIDGATWSQLWASGALPGLALQSAVFLALGFVVFCWGLRRAQEQGNLGSY